MAEDSDSPRVIPMGEGYPDETEVPIQISSIYGHDTHKGLVNFTLADKSVQFSPEQGRILALWLLEASAQAEQDELTVRWLSESMKIDYDRAIMALLDFRALREKAQAEQDNVTPNEAPYSLNELREMMDDEEPPEPEEPEIPEYGEHPGAVIREYDE